MGLYLSHPILYPAAMNPAQKLVETLRTAVLKIDDEWALARDGGLAWWPHRQRQDIFTDRERVAEDGSLLRRVVVTTEVCRLSVPEAATDQLIRDFCALASLSGLVQDPADPCILRLHAHAWVDEDNLPLYKMLLGAVAGLQIHEAATIADAVQKVGLGKPSTSGHPTSGIRPEPDEITTVVGAVFVPMGEADPPWPEGMLEELEEEYFSGPPCLMATADPGGLTAEFPFGLESSLFRAELGASHPSLGSGLWLISSFNVPAGIEDPLALNAWEVEHGDTSFFGSWGLGEESGAPEFATFIPNALVNPAVPSTLILASAHRAKLAAERWADDDWSDAWAPDGTCRAKSAAERMLGGLL